MKSTPKLFFPILLAAAIGALVGAGVTYFLTAARPETGETRIKEFYLTETAVYVSPHSLRKRMDKGETNYILVDVRSPQEYTKEHIVSAINIPAYKTPEQSISLEAEVEEKDRIVNAFRELPQGKEIIVYCYSMPCMTGRKIGALLANNGMYVKHLGVGWNEWRYFWNLWNHDGETPTKVEDYITRGATPGTPKQKENPLTPCSAGELGC